MGVPFKNPNATVACRTAPGTLFHAVRRPGTLMRVNFATAQEARFWQRVVELRGRAQ